MRDSIVHHLGVIKFLYVVKFFRSVFLKYNRIFEHNDFVFIVKCHVFFRST